MTVLQTTPNIFRRCIAGLIDYALVIGFFYSYLFSFGKPDTDGEYTIKGLLTLVPILLWFIIIILPEVVLGATLGNSIVDLKPRSLTKNKIKNWNFAFICFIKKTSDKFLTKKHFFN